MEWAEELFTLKKSAKKGRRAAAAAAALSPSNEVPSNSGVEDSATKPGSGNSITSIANSLETDLKLTTSTPPSDGGNGRPPRRAAATGWWADESTNGGGCGGAGGRSGSGGGGKNGAGLTGTNSIELERFSRTVNVNAPTRKSASSDPLLDMDADADFDANVDVDDIPHIPDLDDLVSDLDYTTPAAVAATPAADDATTTSASAAATSATGRVAAYRELNADLLRSGAFAALDGIDLALLARCLGSEAEVQEPDEVWTWDALFAEVTAAGGSGGGGSEATSSEVVTA